MATDGRRGRAPTRPNLARPPTVTPRQKPPFWTTSRGMAVLVAVVVGAAFARSLGNGFTYDEPLVLVTPQVFLKSSQFGELFSKSYFTASLEGTWRPFVTFTYMLDAMIAFHPAVFRATSVLWHIGAAWLLMALARRLLPEKHRRLALVAGLVFGLHPIVTETVDNASFREDTLVTFWTLATLLFAMDGRRALSLVAFVLGLFSKESAIVAPALLALVRVASPGPALPAGRARRRTLLRWAVPLPSVGEAPGAPPEPSSTLFSRAWPIARELVPYGVVAAVYLAIRFGPMNTVGQYALPPGGTLAGTMRGMPAVWAHYLRLLVVPWPLCADYTGYFAFGPEVPLDGQFLPLVSVLAFAALVVAAWRRGHLILAFGLTWFGLALGPVSNFIPVPIPAAERFLTLPLAGIALAAAAAAALAHERLSPKAWRAARAAGVGALAVFFVITNLRHGAWKDDATLWVDTVSVNPRACGAQSAVGGALLSRGIAERSESLLRDAAAHQQLALKLCADARDPQRAAMIYTRLGAAQVMLNQPGPARVSLERALALAPDSGLAVVWLGYAAFLSGDREQAARLLKYAIIDLGPPDSSVAQVAQWYVDKL